MQYCACQFYDCWYVVGLSTMTGVRTGHVCRWVDGELLHFSGDGVSTRGAELGFVWTGNQSHFLIILKRIDLSDQED